MKNTDNDKDGNVIIQALEHIMCMGDRGRALTLCKAMDVEGVATERLIFFLLQGGDFQRALSETLLLKKCSTKPYSVDWSSVKELLYHHDQNVVRLGITLSMKEPVLTKWEDLDYLGKRGLIRF